MSSVPVVSADASRNLALLQGCQSILDTALWYRSHFKVGNWTLGQAAQQAMQRLYDIGSNFDLIHTDSIFGDPVLHLRSPYSLQGSPTAQNADGPHGSAVEYTFQVTNTGTITDTVVFDLLGGAWPVILPQPVPFLRVRR